MSSQVVRTIDKIRSLSALAVDRATTEELQQLEKLLSLRLREVRERLIQARADNAIRAVS